MRQKYRETGPRGVAFYQSDCVIVTYHTGGDRLSMTVGSVSAQ